MAIPAHETCFKCGVEFWMTDQFMRSRRSDKGTFYCPNGHAQVYTTSEADKLRRELDNAKQQIARAEDEAREALAREAKAISAKRRIEKRIHAGVCPCCNRSFPNLQRHMAAKHPDGKVVPLKVTA